MLSNDTKRRVFCEVVPRFVIPSMGDDTTLIDENPPPASMPQNQESVENQYGITNLYTTHQMGSMNAIGMGMNESDLNTLGEFFG